MHFSDFSFNKHITAAVQRCGYTEPTPIQSQAMGPILEGRDLLGLAQTGTGKTAAFILPLAQHLMQGAARSPRALIIAPTRELVQQIDDFIRQIIARTSLHSVAVYGGVSKIAQINQIRKGVDIVVACPGRLLDLLNDRAVDLSRISTLILDEADHMFDQGFLPDIRRILRQVPEKRQTLIFSATMPEEIRHLANDILKEPVAVQINPTHSVPNISHQLYMVDQNKKTDLLVHLLHNEAMPTTLVFVRTRHKAKSLEQKLEQSGFQVASLQGNLSQNKRKQALDGFKNGRVKVLVATDIAARGLDVAGISHVINYDMPDTVEAYIHRTGRTGRASCTGEALSFATLEDRRMLRSIEHSLDSGMKLCAVAEFAASDRTDRSERSMQPRGFNRAPLGRERDKNKPFDSARREKKEEAPRREGRKPGTWRESGRDTAAPGQGRHKPRSGSKVFGVSTRTR